MPRKIGDWHPEDVKAMVRKRGITLRQLSTDNNLRPRACSAALHRPHFAAELVIAEFLGLSPRQIWPSRFDAAGAYRHPRSRKHCTRIRYTDSRLNEASA
jgi:Ner family transcriptional regulator